MKISIAYLAGDHKSWLGKLNNAISEVFFLMAAI